jgi:hypothetical protein
VGGGGHLLWLDLVEGVEVAEEGACSEWEVEPGPRVRRPGVPG